MNVLKMKCPTCQGPLVFLPYELAKAIVVGKRKRPVAACLICRAALFIEYTTVSNYPEYEDFLDSKLADLIKSVKGVKGVKTE